jgi:hypothetical protein
MRARAVPIAQQVNYGGALVWILRRAPLLAPYPSEDMVCWPVSARVGNVKNNDPSLVEPVVLP